MPRFRRPAPGDLPNHFIPKEQPRGPASGSGRTSSYLTKSLPILQPLRRPTLLTEQASSPEDQSDAMAASFQERKMRRRLDRLRRAFDAIDYKAWDREIRFKEINSRMTQILLDMPRMTGSCDTATQLTRESGCKLIQEIKDKMEQYRLIPAEKLKNVLNWEQIPEIINPQVKVDDDNGLLGKRKRSISPDQLLQDSGGARGKKTEISHIDDDDDDDCVITMVRKIPKEEQEAIDTGMAQRDESLWYDPSRDFDEDMLP